MYKFHLIQVRSFSTKSSKFLGIFHISSVFLSFLTAYTFNVSITTLIIIMIGTHYLYAITYAINDFINYHDDRALSYNPEKYSFYKFRFIQFSGRRLGGFLLQTFYYIALTAIFLDFLRKYNVKIFSMIILILAFILLSIVESLSKNNVITKRLSFTLQQIMKMFAFSYIFNIVYTGTYDAVAFMIFLS